MAINGYTGVEIFSATKHTDRDALGARVTQWLRERKGSIELVDTVSHQSSDASFHCVSILVYFKHVQPATK